MPAVREGRRGDVPATGEGGLVAWAEGSRRRRAGGAVRDGLRFVFYGRVSTVLRGHEPYPAWVVRQPFTFLRASVAAERLFPGLTGLSPEQLIETAIEVTTSQLRIELMFPADDAADAYFRAHGPT